VNRILSKLTTKPIWWWERKRSYPIRSRYDRLPPLPVKTGRRRFVVLATPEMLCDAFWAAWSWYRFLRDEDCRLQIAVDGAVSEMDRAAACELFPGVSIESTEWACNYVRPRVPGIQSFFDTHPMGRKLALILSLSDLGPLIYSDYDVLAFQRPGEVIAAIGGDVPRYFAEEVDGARDMQIVQRANELNLDYLPRFNSGFLYIPQGSLSSRLAAQILTTWRARGELWFTEQTVLSFMLQRLGAEALPESRYVISNRRQFYWEEDVDYSAITARHFTGTVRHVMYKYGLPEILQQSKAHCGGELVEAKETV
jgi:hypothetical protein